MMDLIDRQAAIDALQACAKKCVDYRDVYHIGIEDAEYRISLVPSAEPEQAGRLSNKEWIDFLVAQFDISRTSARDMLHVMMQVKREDNFKKQFSQRNGCLVKDLVKEDGGGA